MVTRASSPARSRRSRNAGSSQRDPDTLAYSLGWRLFALAARVGEARLVAEAPPVLRALVRELGESVHLSVRQGDEVLTLLTESPPATLHAPGRVGGLTPLANTSAGRVLAFDLDESELASLGLGSHVAAIARGTGILDTQSCARSSSPDWSQPLHRFGTERVASSPRSMSRRRASGSTTGSTRRP